MKLRDLTPEEKEELRLLRESGESKSIVQEPAEVAVTDDVKAKKKTPPTMFFDPMDRRLSGHAREVVDRNKREYLDNHEMSGVEEQLIKGFGSSVMANNVPEGYMTEPEGIPEQIASGVGSGAGMLTDLMVAKQLGVPAPLAFSMYGAAQPADSIGERALNAGKFLLLDRALNVMPRALVGGVGAVAGKVGGKAAATAATRATIKALENPAGKLVYNQGVFSGLTELEGGSAKDEFWRNLGTSAAFSVPHGTGSPRPQGKASVESPTFRSGGVADPIPGVAASVPMSRYLKGEITRAEYVVESGKAAEKQTGAVSPDKIKAVTEKLNAENEQRVADGKKPKSTKGSVVYSKARNSSISPDVAREISEGLGDFKLSETVDKNRTIQEITKNNPDSAVAKNTLRLGEMSELVESKMKIDYAKEAREVLDEIGLKDDSKAEQLMNRMKDEYDANKEELGDFMARRGNDIISEHGSGVKPVDIAKAVDGLDALDGLYRSYAKERDIINREYSGKGFTERDAYLPKEQRKVNPLANPKQRFLQETEPIQSRAQQDNVSSPGRVRSSREKMRSDGEMKYPREYRGARLLESYIADQAKRIARQPVISASKGISEGVKDDLYMRKHESNRLKREAKELEQLDPDAAEQLREKADSLYSKEIKDAAERTAEAIDGVMQASYNDIRYGNVAKRQEALTSNRLGMTAFRGSREYKRVFNMAKYKLNLPFIMFRQWTSSMQGGAVAQEINPKDMMTAMVKAFKPGGHAEVMDTYTGNIKSNQQGTMRHDATGKVHKPEVRRRGLVEKLVGEADRLSDKPTNKMEELTNRFAMEIGTIVAQKRGLTGRQITDLQSDMIDRIQSSYNRESVAEIRRDPVINALLPAQSYSLTVWNNARFAPNKQMKARVIGAAALSSLVYQFATSYFRPNEKDELDNFALELGLNTLASVVPYSSAVTGLGPGEGKSAPAGLLEDIIGNVPELIGKAVSQEDDLKAEVYYEKAANELIKNLVPAGGQISRAVSADIMNKQGIIADDEKAVASTLGWWVTESGKDYLRKISGHGKKSSKSSVRPR